MLQASQWQAACWYSCSRCFFFFWELCLPWRSSGLSSGASLHSEQEDRSALGTAPKCQRLSSTSWRCEGRALLTKRRSGPGLAALRSRASAGRISRTCSPGPSSSGFGVPRPTPVPTWSPNSRRCPASSARSLGSSLPTADPQGEAPVLGRYIPAHLTHCHGRRLAMMTPELNPPVTWHLPMCFYLFTETTTLVTHIFLLAHGFRCAPSRGHFVAAQPAGCAHTDRAEPPVDGLVPGGSYAGGSGKATSTGTGGRTLEGIPPSCSEGIPPSCSCTGLALGSGCEPGAAVACAACHASAARGEGVAGVLCVLLYHQSRRGSAGCVCIGAYPRVSTARVCTVTTTRGPHPVHTHRDDPDGYACMLLTSQVPRVHPPDPAQLP